MDKPQIIGIGLDGLVGSRIQELLSHEFDFVSLKQSDGIDITNPSTIAVIKEYEDSDFVMHLAAKSDVDGCEKDKELGEAGSAWKINVDGTKNIAEICKETGKKIIYFSTDFVFNGSKPKGDSYSEEDMPDPINWYAHTKYQGELAVEQSGADYVIVRIAFPYRKSFGAKKDFFRSIYESLQKGKKIEAVGDEYFSPTLIDDISLAIGQLIRNDLMGIYHVVGSDYLSSYEAALKIAEIFGFPKDLIEKTKREDFFKGRAPRPFNSTLGNDKIARLGVEMRSFEEGLREIKYQILNSK